MQMEHIKRKANHIAIIVLLALMHPTNGNEAPIVATAAHTPYIAQPQVTTTSDSDVIRSGSAIAAMGVGASTGSDVAMANTAAPAGSGTGISAADAFYIRHGRSRVRHSNDKAAAFEQEYVPRQIRDSVRNTNSKGSGNKSNTTAFDKILFDVVTEPVLMDTTPTQHPERGTTSAPVTHKIRKLHKKKINESIRKSVDKSLGVVRPQKNHRSLAEAEHLQGRPADTDDKEEDEARELGAVMQLADEIDLENSFEAAYQNDEFNEETSTVGDVSLPVTLTLVQPTVSTKSTGARVRQFSADEAPNEVASQFVTFAPIDSLLVDTPPKYVHKNVAHKVAPAATNSIANLNNNSQQSSDLLYINLVHSDTKDSTDSDYGINELRSTNSDESNDFGSTDNDEDTDPNNEEEDVDTDVIEDSGASEQFVLSASAGAEISYNNDSIAAGVDDDDVDVDVDIDRKVLTATDSTTIQSTNDDWQEEHSLGPRHSASTSDLEHQHDIEVKEINFDESSVFDTSEVTMDDGYPPDVIVDDNTKQLVIDDVEGDGDGDGLESDQIRADVINARENKIDLVSKFLQYIEQQHLLGSNCVAGTSLNLGEGVVDRYAQDRFRVEAEVAVNRANMLTRIFKMTSRSAQEDVNLLHASVLSMVEFDEDIFAAGNCFDWNEHPAQPGLFCPFAYRLPPPNLGAIFAKDLATEYHYLGNTSEWFFLARKNAEKVIARNEQYLKSFHLYSNRTEERIEDDTLAVKYEDGRWSKPYYDCGGGNIWMLTYTVPFFGYENGTYHFKGTSGIDIDLRRVDIDQCPQRSIPGTKRPLNIFAGTDKCKQRTTMCEAIMGLGFRRGSYKCLCRKGFYFPDVTSTQKFFNGSLLEEEYEKLMLGKNSTYSNVNEYECLPCAEGCDSCEDASPCIAALNWPMRTSILVLACIVIGLLPPAAWFTFRYQQVKVVRAASPALLRVIALGAFFIYCTNIVMYPNPNLYTCTARIWLRELGFSLTYGALMLKTWRISVIFRVRSAKAVKITDAALLKRLGIICGAIGTCLLVRTLVSPPDVVVGRTADDLKAFLCKTDWWDYTFTSMEVLFLAWGVRLCIMVRKAPSEFNESRFISMAIYNEFLLTCFLNVSMLFLQSPANPDLLYIIFFCHTQLTVTLLLCLIFGSKVYIVLRSGKSHQENIGLGAKASGAKFNFRPQVRTFANPSSITTSTAPVPGTTSGENKLSDQEALEEIRQLSKQLQRIQEMAPPKGVAVMTISSLLDGLKTPGGMMMVAAAATQAANVNQAALRHQSPQAGALPLLSLNNEMQKYSQQLQLPASNNNVTTNATNICLPRDSRSSIPTMVLETPPSPIPPSISYEEIGVNTELSGVDFYEQLLRRTADGHLICSRCLDASKEHYYCCPPRNTSSSSPPPTRTACEQLGSPQPEGSISFANIKLECMCSQSDDLDEDRLPQHRRTNMRSAATNTPPAKGKATRRHFIDTADSITYQICDNCRNKYQTSSKSIQPRDSKEFTKLPSNIGVTRSNELLDCRTDRYAQFGATKAAHSTDDITFYTTTEDDDYDDSESSTSVTKRTSKLQPDEELPRAPTAQSVQDAQTDASMATTSKAAVSQSFGNVSNNSNNSSSPAENSTKATNGAGTHMKRPEKLVLDLNDRSKYTKEVSV